jgi:hypothetical protein
MDLIVENAINHLCTRLQRYFPVEKFDVRESKREIFMANEKTMDPESHFFHQK